METYKEHGRFSATLIYPNIWHIHEATKARPAGLNPDGYFNNTTSVYVINDTTQAFIIDLGNPYEDHQLRELIDELTDHRIKKVAITHNHYDHIGALKNFDDCTIYVPENDGFKEQPNFIYLKDGDTIQLDTLCFNCIETPGHTPGSMVFYEPNYHYLATGDAFGSSYVWLLFMDDVISIYQKSVEKLLALLPTNTRIHFLCGHRYQQYVEPYEGANPLNPKIQTWIVTT